MSEKTVLFDADGVVIKPHEYFSSRYQRDFGVDVFNSEDSFFKTVFKECSVGKKDLKQELKELLPVWGWDKTVDDLLLYWFEGERDINEDVMNIIQGLRVNGVRCGIASDNEPYRARYLEEELDFQNLFDFRFYSGLIGHTKSEPEFFNLILKSLRQAPKDVYYFDDDPKNVAVAKSVGIHAVTFTDFASLASALKSLKLVA